MDTTTMMESIKRAGQGSKRVARRARNVLQPRFPPRPDWWAGTGWEGVRGSGLFDEGWYRETYEDARSAPDALWHYVAIGADAGHDPNPLFSTTWYLATNPDVAAAAVNPLLHYYESGAREGRDPGRGFDTAWYLRTNPDIDPDVINPLGHFLVAGAAEGRPPRAASLRAAGTNVLTVVCVSGEADTPGHYYRVLRFADSVERMGGRAIVLSIDDATGARLSALDGADAVLAWRTPWEPRVEQLFSRARRVGAVVIFDVDDLMFDPSIADVEIIDGIRSQGFTEPDVREMFARVRRTAANSDACTCPTPALAERLRQLHVPVYLLPNGFDDAVVARSRLAARLRAASPRDGLCRIGYAAGSRTHQRDFGIAADAVARVLRAHDDVRLVLYRRAFDLDEFPMFDDLSDRIEWRELVPLEELPFEMARYDVNLAPLEVGNPFCEAKSALKFFEAALVDVPTVAGAPQPFGAVIRAGETGFLAEHAEEWYDTLERLVADAEQRAKIGRAAREVVLWDHGVEHRTQMVKSILDQVLDNGMVAAAAFAHDVNLRQAADARPELAPATVLFERDRLCLADVTVVVPVFNYEELVTDALDSVREQTLTNLDLVVIDDASTDGSRARVLDWLEQHACRFNRAVFLGNDENAGLARTRNNGFDAAETPYVLALDADNMLLPMCCEHLLDAVRITNAAFAYPRIRQFGEFTDLFRREHVVGYLPWVPQRLISSNYIDAMALIRKDSWLAAGGYRQGLRGWEDYDLWCRFAERGSYGLRVPEELARYRVHAQSMLHTETNEPEANPILRADMTSAHPWLALDDRHPDELEADAVTTARGLPRVPVTTKRRAVPAVSEHEVPGSAT
jgi:glycosyltransferase involved in cell wall biosynthesis